MTLLAIRAAFILYPAIAQDAGQIVGSVVGPSGEPMEGAYVYALAVDSPSPGGIREVTTDAKGQFLLQSVRPGRNEVHAYSPMAGYPSNLYAVFQTAPVPVVTVKPGAVIRGLLVKHSVTITWANILVPPEGKVSVRVSMVKSH